MTRRVTFQEAAQLVKQSLDIVDVVGRYVVLKRAGRNYVGLCPFHPDKSPSFYVTPDKQLYKCFACGEGGDTLSFLMKRENKTFGQLIEETAEDLGLEIAREGRRQQAAKSEQDLLLQMHVIARQYYMDQLQRAPAVQQYLAERQIPAEWQAHFGLGYAPAGWENLVSHLKRELPVLQNAPHLLEKSGLANIRHEAQGYYDRFRNRLMIPIQDDRGRVVAFGGRALAAEDNPKYLNSPETPIYVKNRLLYAFAQSREAIRTTKSVVLMEGYFDVISAHMAGVTQAVGVCGTALTENHLKLLQRAGAETFYLCFDSDMAGQNAALRAIDMVQHQLLELGVRLKVIQLPGEKDPDDFLKAHGKAAFAQCMAHAQEFLQFKFSHTLSKLTNLGTPEGRIQAVQTVMPLLKEIRQPVVRQEYLTWVAERIQIAPETLMLELKRQEQDSMPYGYKKSFGPEAISHVPERYKGRKRWSAPQQRSKPEDIRVFRDRLTGKLPVEDKEHLLLSYLFINEDSHVLVMDMVKTIGMDSPSGIKLLEAVEALSGQWQSTNQLVELLTVQFHAGEDTEMLAFLADRVMAGADLASADDGLAEGLQSPHGREKLKREIADIGERIMALRHQQALTSLASDGRQHEQQSDHDTALSIQLQLREQLKARRQPKPSGPAAAPSLSPTRLTPSIGFEIEEEQGV